MNVKKLITISSPYDTYSGYGARSRDIISEIIKSDLYEVKLLPQKWGSTSWGFCKDNPEWSYLNDYQIQPEDHKRIPDIWVQITIPNEFRRVGIINIGITAGIETDLCAFSWIEGLNRMDLNIVSSEHAKRVFKNSIFEKQYPNGNIEKISLNKPVEVLFEGVNDDVYRILKNNDLDLTEVKEDFCFLCVGTWLEGDIGEDRKNIGLTIKAFYEAFKNQENQPALILKTQIGGDSKISKLKVLSKIHQIKKDFFENDKVPNIYLIGGNFTDDDMNKLYNHHKVKSLVSLTKGEGFGRPLLEFSFIGKPIITTYTSGQMDFLKKDFILPLRGGLKNIDNSAINNWLVKDGKWFNVSYIDAVKSFIVVRNNYKRYKEKAMNQKHHVEDVFTKNMMGIKLLEIIK